VTDSFVVLYVEDNEPNITLAKRVLARRPQVTLVVARDGSRGLDMAQKSPPDLMLLDLNLPGDLTGEEVLRELRGDQRTASTPVVIISANPSQEARLRAAGATGYLVKPYDITALLRIIDEGLSRSQRAALEAIDPPG
jgi:CheY-like chemotaxis protein